MITLIYKSIYYLVIVLYVMFCNTTIYCMDGAPYAACLSACGDVLMRMVQQSRAQLLAQNNAGGTSGSTTSPSGNNTVVATNAAGGTIYIPTITEQWFITSTFLHPYFDSAYLAPDYSIMIHLRAININTAAQHNSIPRALLNTTIVLIPTITTVGSGLQLNYQCITNADKNNVMFTGDVGTSPNSISFIAQFTPESAATVLGNCIYMPTASGAYFNF